jgi:endonuclease/exonuclease/phosphatase (EEP) superfamily protein YafD
VQPLDRRLHQAEVLADSLASVPWPVIVAGDFNTSTDFEIRELRQALRPWRLRQVRLPAGATAEGKAMYGLVAGDLVLDHLFYRGLRPGASGIARHITASDHYPVWTVFTWRD